ncbi:MAG: amidohydrolase, partial [Clostridia bacterium]|nr:amidohydrolase [Clostridia bacterium]
MTRPDYQTILAEAKALAGYMTALRRDMHAHPELGGTETRTQALILRELTAMGIEAAPCADTGVLGLLRGGQAGKTIGLRADIDALPIQEETGLPFASQTPGVMHACGHDTHAAALLGAAKLLAAHRASIAGNVKFFFQPDEEGDGGAQRMVDAGCLENPRVDAVFGGHSSTAAPAGH